MAQEEEITTTAWQKADRGKILMQWSFPEYEKPERGPWWYIIAFTLAGLLLWYSFSDSNPLFALIVLLFALIVFTHHRQDPLELQCIIYESGMQIGDRFFRYREIQDFAIIYEPPIIKNLYIEPRNAWLRKEISIPLGKQNPIKIRKLLLDYVDEDLKREEESGNDKLIRLLKL